MFCVDADRPMEPSRQPERPGRACPPLAGSGRAQPTVICALWQADGGRWSARVQWLLHHAHPRQPAHKEQRPAKHQRAQHYTNSTETDKRRAGTTAECQWH